MGWVYKIIKIQSKFGAQKVNKTIYDMTENNKCDNIIQIYKLILNCSELLKKIDNIKYYYFELFNQIEKTRLKLESENLNKEVKNNIETNYINQQAKYQFLTERINVEIAAINNIFADYKEQYNSIIIRVEQENQNTNDFIKNVK